MGKTTKITTFDSTWNPVTGCTNDCPYCYARRLAERFTDFDIMNPDNAPHEAWFPYGERFKKLFYVGKPLTRITKSGDTAAAPYPFGFAPTFHKYRLTEPQQWKTPRMIFVCSMGDLFGKYIPVEWIKDVFDACEAAPHHTYFFLTKNPTRYMELFVKGIMPKNLKNKWFGTTITKSEDPYFYLDAAAATDNDYKYGDFNGFLSIEPIHGDFNLNDKLSEHGIKWVIVGAETGNRVGKIVPEKEWADHIVESCDTCDVPVYMKDSLSNIMGTDMRLEFPM